MSSSGWLSPAALAKNPKLLLCDEPTGALDYQTGKAILKLLQDTCREKGVTVIVITHNSALTPMADRVIRIRNGTVAEEILGPSHAGGGDRVVTSGPMCLRGAF